jgi:copper(I)-binding protein
MFTLRAARGACALILGLACALAPPAQGEVLTVNAPWVRAATGTRSAEAYMEIRSSDDATLIGATSANAVRVTLRSPSPNSQRIDALALPAGTAVQLAPGGYRLLLERANRDPLKLGDHIPLTLIVRDRDGAPQAISITAEVRRRSVIDDHLHPDPHSHDHAH